MDDCKALFWILPVALALGYSAMYVSHKMTSFRKQHITCTQNAYTYVENFPLVDSGSLHWVWWEQNTELALRVVLTGLEVYKVCFVKVLLYLYTLLAVYTYKWKH